MTTQDKVSIGNIVIHRGEPDTSNPYRGHGNRVGERITSVSGDERVKALSDFANHRDTSGYTFWYAPPGGGARRLSGPHEVAWAGSNVEIDTPEASTTRTDRGGPAPR